MKYLFTSLLLIFSITVFAQVNPPGSMSFGAIRSKVIGSPTVAIPADYGIIYYDTDNQVWRYSEGNVLKTFSGGSGSVTSLSVTSANGFAGSVSNPTTTPAITLSTSITGLLKGNGTAISTATPGTDYTTSSSTETFTNKTWNGVVIGSNYGGAGSINGLLKANGSGVVSLAGSGTDYAPAITGGATTIATSNLTTARALISDGSGKVAVSSTVSDTELGYLDGVTSAIQTQFGNKQPLNTNLTQMAATTPSSNQGLLYNGTTWVATTFALDPTTTDEDMFIRRSGVITRQPVGANGYVLTVTGGVVGWAAPPSGSPTGSAGGDLAGTYPNPTFAIERWKVTGTTTLTGNATVTGAFTLTYTNTSSTWTGALGSVIIDPNGRLRLSGVGLSFDGTTGTAANSINYSTGLSTHGYSATGRHNISFGTITNQQTIGEQISAAFAPNAGSGGYELVFNQLTINQVGANGNGSVYTMRIVPTAVVGTWNTIDISSSAAVNSSNPFYGVRFRLTQGTAQLYGFISEPTAAFNGFGTGVSGVPLDVLHVVSGTARFGGNSTSAGLLKIMEDTDDGTNYTTVTIGPQSANINYTLPTAAPSFNGYVLSSTTAGAMSWIPAGARKLTTFSSSVSNSGTGETDLFTYTVPTNTFSVTNDEIVFEGAGDFTDASATCTMKMYFAGSLLLDTGAIALTAGANSFNWKVVVIRTGSTTATAYAYFETKLSTTSVVYEDTIDLTSQDFTVTNIVKITGTAGGGTGGSGDIVAKLGKVVIYPN